MAHTARLFKSSAFKPWTLALLPARKWLATPCCCLLTKPVGNLLTISIDAVVVPYVSWKAGGATLLDCLLMESWSLLLTAAAVH
jgi:hypothetical protein